MTHTIKEFLELQAVLAKKNEDAKKEQLNRVFLYEDIKQTEAKFFEVEFIAKVDGFYKCRVLTGRDIGPKFDLDFLYFKQSHNFFDTFVDFNPIGEEVVTGFNFDLLQHVSARGTFIAHFAIRGAAYLNTGNKLLTIKSIRVERFTNDLDQPHRAEWKTLYCRKPVKPKTERQRKAITKRGNSW